jgi:5-methylcytosine-specific restriction endonuclease McrA
MMTMNVNQRSVLLLNQGFQPLKIITLRDAVDLMLRGVVDKVDGIAARLQTPSTIFEVPSVLRLRHYVRAPSRRAVWSRRNILRRDNYTCAYCGVKPGDIRRGEKVDHADMTLDHIIPQDQGGGNTWGNTCAACRWCNHRKANRSPHQAGMKLLFEPKRPRSDYLIWAGELPVEWKIYLEI